jgi:hypothetical protein
MEIVIINGKWNNCVEYRCRILVVGFVIKKLII